MSRTTFTRYVALGDSLTEGLCDRAPGQADAFLGWADRLAGILDGDARLAGASLEFANLAVRGRRIADVVDAQIPHALDLRPDLVSVMIGGNDLMSPAADPDALATRLEAGIRDLRAAGTTVLLANIFDPQFAFFLKPFRGRAAVFNANIWSIARDQRAIVLDVWGVREFRDPAMWASDRVHLSTRGHRLLAAQAAHALGVPYAEVSGPETTVAPEATAPVPPDSVPFRTWLRVYAIPWIARRVRHVSTGDGMGPKLPVPQRVDFGALSAGSGLSGPAGLSGGVGGQH
ncbi:SGNH/GDSL hydrolase family protein [Cryocola sp. 340MFSha3.1]|uniref:SGNH/GDSL hydrolase family protein n=1 Tax=Cryocola sp. 340MFSha3.1 TaxID=1169145 RepID=UPI000368433E|nr:SGNH/GDSL hydrolase family protein [Cryocola sp. 340MFSha3.1]